MTLKQEAVPAVQIDPIVRAILVRRGLDDEAMRLFLEPDYLRDLHDPYLLTDMSKAIARIQAAAASGEKVVVYGDYDIDGITASAVMIEGLAANGVAAESYIPDRFEEGYGINKGALETLKSQGVQLVISVDCGITSVEEAAWARAHGMDLIITDHHAVPAVLPECIAVINPKRPGDEYPCKELAGVGVAFKVISALQQRTSQPAAGQEKWLLDLVALGTVCDVVPLSGENRALASYGLRVLRKTRRVGLRELARVAGVDTATLTARDLGFVLGPRMNASGRLEHARRSFELVSAGSQADAAAWAAELDELNTQRRADQAAIFEAASELAQQYEADPVLVLAHKDWSHGVVGIVASKLMEQWQKPVLVAQILGETTKGSARSIGQFNMVEALRANADILAKFGGHFYAAGFTLPTQRIEEFRAGMNEHWRSSGTLGYEKPMLEIDVVVGNLGDIRMPLLDELSRLEPYGSANPEPVFELRGLTLKDYALVGNTGKHLRFELADDMRRTIGCIGFGLGELNSRLAIGQRLTVRGHVNKNEFRGITRLQLVAKEIDFE